MAEQDNSFSLSDLLAKHQVTLEFSESKTGIPLVTVNFPSFEMIPEQGDKCEGCGQEARMILCNKYIHHPSLGLELYFRNLRFWKVYGCGIDLALEGLYGGKWLDAYDKLVEERPNVEAFV